MKFSLAALVATMVVSLPATAGPIFSDNFDSENGGNVQLNYNDFAKWNVLGGGTVDLIGAGGSFDLIPGNGRYVDLDGSTNQAGLFATQMNFAPGNYLIEFSLGGSHRSSTETVTVSLGNWSEQFTMNASDPFVQFSRTISTTGGSLSFQNSNAGGSPNVGALLDNVSVSAAAIPEPATLAVFGGIALAGVFGYRRRKATA